MKNIFSSDGYDVKFVDECFVSVRRSDVGNVGLGDVVSLMTANHIVRTQPMLLQLQTNNEIVEEL